MVVGFKSPHVPRSLPSAPKTALLGKCHDVPNLHVPAPFESLIAALTYASGENRYANFRGQTPSEFMLDYFRCISAADDCLGRILDTLDQLGLSENPMVMYSSTTDYLANTCWATSVGL